MNKKILEILLTWPKAYITGVDLHQILDKSSNSRHAIIKRAINNKELIPLRRDLYLIKNPKLPIVNAFEIAPIIYGPSYVSFESALSYHGWIPEAVRTTTCATIKKTKVFETPLGVYSYEHIPTEAFSFGVEQKEQNGVMLFIANPLKALADIIYARKRSWSTTEDLYEDLRIEPTNFKNSDKNLLNDLIKNYPSKRVRNSLHILQKGINL